MWRPRTEAEIQTAIENGIVRESASFDAKQALPPPGRNKDLAEDICAMSVDGGSLLYGIGGDDRTRPGTLVPFALAGAAERIDQVAQTGIAEPPVIEIYDIPSDAHPGRGYLCVAVPASPRAPHMLTIDGDNRYWGRGAIGNRILTEGEVARLYERRERWEINRDTWLASEIEPVPFTFDIATVGLAATVARPVMPGRALLRVAAGQQRVDEFLRQGLLRVGRQSDIYPDQGTSGLGEAQRIAQAGADAWVCSDNLTPENEYQACLEITADGALKYWHSPLLRARGRDGSQLIVMERSITRAIYQTLAVTAWLYERARFHGPVDVGVAVLGIANVGGASYAAHGGAAPVYGGPDYRRHERVTREELRSELHDLVRRLLAPLYEVISAPQYDPFGNRPLDTPATLPVLETAADVPTPIATSALLVSGAMSGRRETRRLHAGHRALPGRYGWIWPAHRCMRRYTDHNSSPDPLSLGARTTSVIPEAPTQDDRSCAGARAEHCRVPRRSAHGLPSSAGSVPLAPVDQVQPGSRRLDARRSRRSSRVLRRLRRGARPRQRVRSSMVRSRR